MSGKIVHKPHWFNEWVKVCRPITADGIGWIRSRPPCIQKQMETYPPSCVVMVTNLICPDVRPLAFGIVSVYHEDEDFLTIRLEPDADIFHDVRFDCLEVVGYWNGLTPAKVREICKDEPPAPSGV